MTLNDFFAASMKSNLDMLKMHLNDMSDADLMVRPVANANHANWQIGHMILSEVWFVSKSGGKVAELPAGFAEMYAKDKASSDDASKFAKKADLLATFDKVRAATIEWVKGLSPAQFSAPSPMPQMFPTVADIANLATMHVVMHVGQIQVLRRKQGKPVMF